MSEDQKSTYKLLYGTSPITLLYDNLAAKILAGRYLYNHTKLFVVSIGEVFTGGVLCWNILSAYPPSLLIRWGVF